MWILDFEPGTAKTETIRVRSKITRGRKGRGRRVKRLNEQTFKERQKAKLRQCVRALNKN